MENEGGLVKMDDKLNFLEWVIVDEFDNPIFGRCRLYRRYDAPTDTYQYKMKQFAGVLSYQDAAHLPVSEVRERLENAWLTRIISELTKTQFIHHSPLFYRYGSVKTMPTKKIINDNAAVLFWSDGSKTVVKRSQDDTPDPVKAFLWAYFLHGSGMSRTKANKFLASLVEREEHGA